MFYSEANLWGMVGCGGEAGYLLAQAEAGPKFRHLRKGENLNESLVNKHFVLIDL